MTGPTKEQQMAYIEERGQLVFTGSTTSYLGLKYYKLGDSVYKLVYNNDTPVTFIKLSIEEAKKILNCSDIDFGVW